MRYCPRPRKMTLPPSARFTPYRAVSLEKVTLVYGATRALGGLSLTFEAGQVTTLEGPNGAGKSSLLGVISTLLRPTQGRVRWGDLRLPDDRAAVCASLGLVAHASLVYPDLTPRESLGLLARLHSLDAPDAAAARALEEHHLGALADRPARTFSRGQLQRLALARAALHDPCLYLFDEPTTGLDPGAVARLERFIEGLKAREKIVVLVTHDLAFASRVADRRVGLERGRIRSDVRR